MTEDKEIKKEMNQKMTRFFHFLKRFKLKGNPLGAVGGGGGGWGWVVLEKSCFILFIYFFVYFFFLRGEFGRAQRPLAAPAEMYF